MLSIVSGARFENRKNRRQSPRRNFNVMAWIRLDGGFAARQCSVLDLSETGVRLFVRDAKIPGKLMLLFSKDAPGKPARTVWLSGNQIGAEFL
jgi:PilZ domain-containing protein